MELLALRAVVPRRAARGGWVKGASLTTAEPPALRGLVLSQRDKTHHLVPATFNHTRQVLLFRAAPPGPGAAPFAACRLCSAGARATLAGILPYPAGIPACSIGKPLPSAAIPSYPTGKPFPSASIPACRARIPSHPAGIPEPGDCLSNARECRSIITDGRRQANSSR